MYFDESLYENELHYRLAQYLDELEKDPEEEELRIVCDNVEQYNEMLDRLYRYKRDSIRIFSVPNNPMEIIIEKDPRLKYRKFDESSLMDNVSTETA